jgi:hypothetical protein
MRPALQTGGENGQPNFRCGMAWRSEDRPWCHQARQRRVRGPVLLQLALRRGRGYESRRADCGGPRGMLLDGAGRCAVRARACAEQNTHERQGAIRTGPGWVCDHHGSISSRMLPCQASTPLLSKRSPPRQKRTVPYRKPSKRSRSRCRPAWNDGSKRMVAAQVYARATAKETGSR